MNSLENFLEKNLRSKALHLLKLVTILLILNLSIQVLFAQESSSIYSTWDAIELDTVASAWLLKRFINSKATFKFYPQGEFITEGIPFDTPDAEFRRMQNQSTFESILNKYKINDPMLLEMGKIIHDIEINYWQRKLTDKSETIEREVRNIINSTEDKDACFEKGFIYFDELYRELK